VPEDYVHRIGRTGRAGVEGEAISLVCHDERPQLKDIEKLIKRTLERLEIAGFEQAAVAAPRPAPQPRPPRKPAAAGKPAGARNASPRQQRHSGSRHR